MAHTKSKAAKQRHNRLRNKKRRLERALNGTKNSANLTPARAMALRAQPARSATSSAPVTGHGDYTHDPASKSAQKWAKLGGLGADFIDTLFGFGDYHEKLKYNTLLPGRAESIMASGGPPTIRNRRSTRGWTAVKREYFGELSGSVNFAATSYLINPTNGALFPFLAGIAANFDEFMISGMLVELNSEASNTATSNLGAMIVSTQYDVNSLPFANKTQMLNYQFTKSCKPTENLIHGIECAGESSFARVLFTSNSDRSGVTRDPNLANLGLLTIATQGQPNTSVIAEQWVTYDIDLLKDKLFPTISQSQSFTVTGNGTMTSANPFGTAVTVAITPSVNGTPGIFAAENLITNAVPTNASVPGVYWTASASTVVFPSYFAGHSVLAVCFASGTTFSTNWAFSSSNNAIGSNDVTFTGITEATSGTVNTTASIISFASPRPSAALNGTAFPVTFTGPVNATMTNSQINFMVWN